jgi:hypothetical protein
MNETMTHSSKQPNIFIKSDTFIKPDTFIINKSTNSLLFQYQAPVDKHTITIKYEIPHKEPMLLPKLQEFEVYTIDGKMFICKININEIKESKKIRVQNNIISISE